MPIEVPCSLIQCENGTATRDQVRAAIVEVTAIKEQANELGGRMEAAVLAWIKEHGDIQIGDIRYYAGTERTTKCINANKLLEAVLTETGGDLDQVISCLNSDPFKPGACRTLLGDQMYRHFKTTTKADLKTGKPLKRLKKTNR